MTICLNIYITYNHCFNYDNKKIVSMNDNATELNSPPINCSGIYNIYIYSTRVASRGCDKGMVGRIIKGDI